MHDFLFFGLCLSAFFLVLVRNPVFSSLFLILLFCIGSFMIFLLGVIEYVALLYIIVYVGAVAVLFLFVIMMIDVRVLEERYSSIGIVPGLLTFIFLIFIHIYMYFYIFDLSYWSIISFDYISYYFYTTIDFNNLQIISSSFFSIYGVCFIICGFLLLAGMIGALAIALEVRYVVKQQNLYTQIARTNSLVFYSNGQA